MPNDKKNPDRDKATTQNQDNFNNFSNYKQSKAIGDTKSAQHWRDNWLGGIGSDR